MSDVNYAGAINSKQQHEYAMREQYAAVAASSERDTARVQSRSLRQADEINEMSASVRSLADQLYGSPPAPPSQLHGSGAVPVESSLMGDIDSAQSAIDSAIITLREQFARLGRL